MLLSWQALALGSELSQTAADAETSIAWLDDVIDIAILSSLIRISKLVCILLLFLCQECLHVLAGFLLSLGFLATENGNGTLAPITAISDDGQAKFRSARNCLQPITMWLPP